jgi:hypothetical protein
MNVENKSDDQSASGAGYLGSIVLVITYIVFSRVLNRWVPESSAHGLGMFLAFLISYAIDKDKGKPKFSVWVLCGLCAGLLAFLIFYIF